MLRGEELAGPIEDHKKPFIVIFSSIPPLCSYVRPLFQHAVYGLKFLIAKIIPDVPRRIYLAIRRERYVAKLALEEALYGPTDERPTSASSSLS